MTTANICHIPTITPNTLTNGRCRQKEKLIITCFCKETSYRLTQETVVEIEHVERSKEQLICSAECEKDRLKKTKKTHWCSNNRREDVRLVLVASSTDPPLPSISMVYTEKQEAPSEKLGNGPARNDVRFLDTTWDYIGQLLTGTNCKQALNHKTASKPDFNTSNYSLCFAYPSVVKPHKRVGRKVGDLVAGLAMYE